MGLSHYYQFNVFCVTRTPFVYTIFCFVFAYRYVNGIFLKNFRVFGDIVTNRYKRWLKCSNSKKEYKYPQYVVQKKKLPSGSLDTYMYYVK